MTSTPEDHDKVNETTNERTTDTDTINAGVVEGPAAEEGNDKPRKEENVQANKNIKDNCFPHLLKPTFIMTSKDKGKD